MAMRVPFDRLLIATGVRSRQWPNPAEAALDGVYTLRTSGDAARLQSALAAGPKRVLIIGAGFIGSEVASVCRDLGLEVTVAERAAAPLAGALGGVIGGSRRNSARAWGRPAHRRRRVGAGRRCRRPCAARPPFGRHNARGRCRAGLARINSEHRMAGGRRTGRRLLGRRLRRRLPRFDINGVVTDNIFVAGDIARAPHVLFEYQFLSMEHWDNAVLGAEIAAHNMVSDETQRRPHLLCPASGRDSSASTSSRSACRHLATRSCLPRARSNRAGSPQPMAAAAASSAPSPSITASGCNSTARRLQSRSVPAARGRLRPAGRCNSPAGRLPGPRCPDRRPRRCADRTRPKRTVSRIPAARPLIPAIGARGGTARRRPGPS